MRAYRDPGSELIPRSPHRRGLTLAEVLISLLVLAIGLMGVLALYPLGAKQMALAVKDERTSQLADTMEGMFRVYWRDACLRPDGTPRTEAEFFQHSPELQQLDVVGPSTVFDANLASNGVLKSSAPSKVLFLDPIGFGSSGGVWVGGVNGLLPRRSMSMIGRSGFGPIAGPIRFCSLLDDMSFNANGVANPVVREYRYNAAMLLQRAKNNARHEVNLKVIVYQSRPPADTPPIENLVGSVSLSPDSESITASLASVGIPTVPAGSWILLVGQGDGSTQPFGDFYRVVGSSGNIISVTPPVRRRAGTAGYSGQLFVLDGVAEVFDRGTITPTEVPAS